MKAWVLKALYMLVARAMQFDDKARAYIAEHPAASVINLRAGLDTTFYRIDNGSIESYDLDFPNVIDVRRKLLPNPTGQRTCKIVVRRELV